MANDIKLGDGAIDNIMLGGDQVDKVMLGDVEVWTHAAPAVDFYAEVTMADTAKVFKVRYAFSSTHTTWQYSSDGINWLDPDGVGTYLEKTGSLKWYVRQKPGETDVDHFSFQQCEMKTVDDIKVDKFTSFSSLFNLCDELESVSNALNTSNGTSFNEMFYGCIKLVSSPDLDTSKGITFNGLFQGCTALVNTVQLDFSSATNITAIYNGCTALTYAKDVSAPLSTTNYGIFYNCSNLVCIKGIDTSSNTAGTNMFDGCTSLVAPDAADQALIAATPGIAWTNPNPCP